MILIFDKVVRFGLSAGHGCSNAQFQQTAMALGTVTCHCWSARVVLHLWENSVDQCKLQVLREEGPWWHR